jgi:hypothetical protein
VDVDWERGGRLEEMQLLLGRDMEWVGLTEVWVVHQGHDSEHPDSCQDRERMKIEGVEHNHLPARDSHLAGREAAVEEEALED